MDFPGYSIGGTSVGEPKDVMYKMVDDAVKWLPEDKPRYLMGVGNPIDLIECAIPVSYTHLDVYKRQG